MFLALLVSLLYRKHPSQGVERVDHFLGVGDDGVLFPRQLGQEVAAARPLPALNESGSLQREKDLLQELHGDRLPLRDLLDDAHHAR